MLCKQVKCEIMKRLKERDFKWVFIVIVVLLATGCAPGPPPPPVFPGFEWIIVAVLVIAAGVLLWRKLDVSQPKKEDHLAEVLNAIHRQLKELEEKIDKLEKMDKKEKKKSATKRTEKQKDENTDKS